MNEEQTPSSPQVAQVGRNEPCPCGSGKKYKRCHGADAAPKLTPPKSALPAGAPAGFDPSQFDPQMLMQFSQMVSRLPKGQMQRLQSLMQRAMAGKDVTREAAEFEKTLPLEFQEALRAMQMPGMTGMEGAVAAAPEPAEEAAAPDMSVDDARKIVEDAVAAGKLTREEADRLLKR